MKILLNKDGLPQKQLMKLVIVGFTIGGSIAFLVAILFALLNFYLSGNLNNLGSPNMVLLFLPIVMLLYGFILSLIIGLGLWIYKKFKPIRIEQSNE